MIRQLGSDFRYGWFSKTLLGTAVLFIAAALLIFFVNAVSARENAIAFQHTAESYLQNGEDIAQALREDYEIIQQSDENDMMTIKNPLPYHYEMLSQSVYSMSYGYVFSLLCEGGILFLPIVSAFFGLIWVTSDLKNKTLRGRVQRLGKQRAFWSKQLSGYLMLLILFLLTVPAALGIQAYFRSNFYREFPLDPSAYSYEPEIEPEFWKQLLFSACVILLFYEIGYTFGNILKGNPVAIVIVCVYVLLVPVFFRYDITNVIKNFAREIFVFAGACRIEKLLDASLIWGGLELAGIMAAMLLCNALIAQKRSAYV